MEPDLDELSQQIERLVQVMERGQRSPEPELLDAAGVAELLSLGERTVRRLDVEGRLPRPLKIGGAVRWRLAELRAWLAAGAPPRQRWETVKAAS